MNSTPNPKPPEVKKIPMGVSARDSLEILTGEGVSGKLSRTRKTRKPRDTKLYDASMVALLCGKHVPKAIETIAYLMKNSKREAIQLKSATTLIELACELDPSAGDPNMATPRVYILASAPQTIQNAADEARKRRLAAITVAAEPE